MNQLRIYPTSINQRFIDQAAEALRRGQIIIYPTDTLYALGCDALNQQAIDRLCRLKGINTQKNTLSIVCADISMASRYARIDNRAFDILRRYLPGPYTFLLPASNALPKVFKGRRIVGIRVPANPIDQALSTALDGPILSTSIPTDGLSEEEITYPDEIYLRFESKDVDLLIDGGHGSDRLSTVVDLTDSTSPEIIRQGAADFNS